MTEIMPTNDQSIVIAFSIGGIIVLVLLTLVITISIHLIRRWCHKHGMFCKNFRLVIYTCSYFVCQGQKENSVA